MTQPTESGTGESLAARFASGPQPVRQVLFWGAQIADALAEMHATGRAYRCLEPDQVLLVAGPEGAALVQLQDAASTADAPPADAPSNGTAARYRPPEAWDGSHGPAGDLYQLGLILHEGLRGVPCFDGPPDTLMRAHRYSPPPPLSGVDPAVSGTVMRLLAKAPAARPPHAAELGVTLRALAAATPEDSMGLSPDAGGDWPAARSNMPSIVGKVWLFTSLSLVLVLAGILVSSRLGNWDLPGSRVVEAPPVVFPRSTSSGWILPPAAAAASEAAAREAARVAAASTASAASTPRSARLFVEPPDATVRWGTSTCAASPCDLPAPVDVRVERAGYRSLTLHLAPGAVERVRLEALQ